MKKTHKSILIVFLIGSFISAQQASSEELPLGHRSRPQRQSAGGARSVVAGELRISGGRQLHSQFSDAAHGVRTREYIDCGEHELDLGSLARAGAGSALPRGSLAPMRADTLETFDIELEKKEQRNIYKEIAAFVIIAAMVGYIVVTLIDPGDEEEVPDTGGKDVPTAFLGITVPVTP
jgi:hypothetical protein